MVKRNRNTVLGWCAVWLLVSAPAAAGSGDEWWDEAWPYRVPVSVSGSGVAQVSINFTAAFSTLGLNGALLDLRSIRVVPYVGSSPQSPIPHDETLSTVLTDADSPQIGWHASGVYWTVNDGAAVADGTRFSEGTGSLKATVDNLPGGYGYPGVELHIAGGDPLTDWRDYEACSTTSGRRSTPAPSTRRPTSTSSSSTTPPAVPTPTSPRAGRRWRSTAGTGSASRSIPSTPAPRRTSTTSPAWNSTPATTTPSTATAACGTTAIN